MASPLDIRALLRIPVVYRWFRRLTRGRREDVVFAGDYLRARAGDRILDVGCGDAELMAVLPPVHYVGVDVEPSYVRAAQRRFGERATLICGSLDEALVERLGPASFDIVSAHGLLHHLDDADAAGFLRLAWSALKPGGRLVTLDGCLVEGQSRLVRYLLSRDRGRHVRTREGYLALARGVFPRVDAEIRGDMFRIPYTLIVLVCHRPL